MRKKKLLLAIAALSTSVVLVSGVASAKPKPGNGKRPKYDAGQLAAREGEG